MTAASTRASRKPKFKTSERKWCTCQERCKGGKEVAASTYRTHNPTGRDGAVGSVGNKRKVAPDDQDGVHLESGVRETRRMRARRVAEGGGELTGTFGLGCVQARLQERGMVSWSWIASSGGTERHLHSTNTAALKSGDTPKVMMQRRMITNRRGHRVWRSTIPSRTQWRSTKITERTTTFGLPSTPLTRWCRLYSPGIDPSRYQPLPRQDLGPGISCARPTPNFLLYPVIRDRSDSSASPDLDLDNCIFSGFFVLYHLEWIVHHHLFEGT